MYIDKIICYFCQLSLYISIYYYRINNKLYSEQELFVVSYNFNFTRV